MDIEKYKQQCNGGKKRKAIKTLEQYSDKKETSIEKKMRLFFDSHCVYYKAQFGVEQVIVKKKEYRVFDFYVCGVNSKGIQYNFLVECDGDYWHARGYQEGSMPRSKLSKLQKNNLRNDKLKDEIAKKAGLPLLRFFERDIKWKFEYVQKTILEFIEDFGSSA